MQNGIKKVFFKPFLSIYVSNRIDKRFDISDLSNRTDKSLDN